MSTENYNAEISTFNIKSSLTSLEEQGSRGQDNGTSKM
jgi:hypothetical protein